MILCGATGAGQVDIPATLRIISQKRVVGITKQHLIVFAEERPTRAPSYRTFASMRDN